MKGLLIKDMRLMLNQKNFFMILAMIAVGTIFITQDFSFIIGYMTFICSLFVLSTISYDEFDNGNAFLFTLPITKQEYVLEKYIFGILCSGLAWAFSNFITIIFQFFTIPDFMLLDWLLVTSTFIPIVLFLLSVMIPFQLHFGGEKGRIAMLGAFGITFIIGFIVVQIISLMNINIDALIESLSLLNMSTIMLILLIVSLLCLFISYSISVKLMKSKEF